MANNEFLCDAWLSNLPARLVAWKNVVIDPESQCLVLRFYHQMEEELSSIIEEMRQQHDRF